VAGSGATDLIDEIRLGILIARDFFSACDGHPDNEVEPEVFCA
jgi:hypothetical protein